MVIPPILLCAGAKWLASVFASWSASARRGLPPQFRYVVSAVKSANVPAFVADHPDAVAAGQLCAALAAERGFAASGIELAADIRGCPPGTRTA